MTENELAERFDRLILTTQNPPRHAEMRVALLTLCKQIKNNDRREQHPDVEAAVETMRIANIGDTNLDRDSATIVFDMVAADEMNSFMRRWAYIAGAGSVEESNLVKFYENRSNSILRSLVIYTQQQLFAPRHSCTIQ